MSIDLSKVTALSDEKGVLTQIADASGRVLWKQAPKSVTVILRPTADIDPKHNVYPSGSAVYACIDEEVADGDATYIYGSGTAYSSVVIFTGTIPEGMSVIAARAVWVGKYKSGDSKAMFSVNTVDADYNATGSASMTFSSESYAQFSAEGDDTFVADLRSFGAGNVSVPARIAGMSLDTSNKSATYYITQVYIELTCE